MGVSKAPLVPKIKKQLTGHPEQVAQGSGNGKITTQAPFWKHKGWLG